MERRRGAILPLALLALCCVVARHHDAFAGPSPARSGVSPAEARLGPHRAPPAASGTALGARGGDDDTIEVSGYSGLVVGLALLPHVVYILYTAFTIIQQGAAVTAGTYGITAVSAFTTVGLTCWSLGSFVLRGRGLPAGPLGLLGLSEGLSYLGSLAVAAVLVTKGVGGTLPSIPGMQGLSLPKFEAPKLEAPAFKAPDFKAPDFKVPDFKAPDFKVPDFKAPDIKVPEIKAPEIKVPEIKAPEPKPAPKAEAPKAEAPKPAPKAEAPKPAPKAEAPKAEVPKPAPKPAPKAEAPKASFADLFDD